MTEVKQSQIDCYYNDDLVINFAVKDADGIDVNVHGASATYKISARNKENISIVSYASTDSPAKVTLSGSTATVSFNTGALGQPGMYKAQLRITKSNVSMISAEHNINVSPVIS